MIKNKFVAFGLFIFFVIVICNLLDYLYATMINHSVYQFSSGSDLFVPLAVGVVVGYFMFIRDKK